MSSAESDRPLPSDAPGQRYVLVHAMCAGSFHLPDREVFDDALDTDTGSKVPSFAFLLEHEEHGKILFDLGLRKVPLFSPCCNPLADKTTCPRMDRDIRLH